MIINDKNKDSCSKLIRNFTSHPATLPQGIIGYIEIPIIQISDTTIPFKQNDYTDMNLYTRVIPQSLLDYLLSYLLCYLYLLSQETFDLQIKSEKIFLPYHILQKINKL